MIIQLPLGNVPVVQSYVNRMRAQGAPSHPVLTELRRDVFRGGSVWVLLHADTVISINCTRIGKRKKNVWEPYGNWYGAYTMPGYRRQGFATELYAHVEPLLVAAGCRRIRSLAGSSAGLALHHSLRHACWGKTENSEVWVDSALPGHEGSYVDLGAPPQAPGELLSNSEVKQLIKEGLRYDAQA